MTPQELNEGVAKALGLTWRGGTIVDSDGVQYHRNQGNFATDERAAVWALERYCKEHGTVAVLDCRNKWSVGIRKSHQSIVTFDPEPGSFCKKVCKAITRAGE